MVFELAVQIQDTPKAHMSNTKPDKGISLSVSPQHQPAYSPFPSTHPRSERSRSKSIPYLEPPTWCLSDTEQPIRLSPPTSLDPAYPTCIFRVHGRRPVIGALEIPGYMNNSPDVSRGARDEIWLYGGLWVQMCCRLAGRQAADVCVSKGAPQSDLATTISIASTIPI